MKCLSKAKVLSANGRRLHDSHAEILALRSFNHFLMQECKRLSKYPSETSRFVIRRESPDVPAHAAYRPFCVNPNLKIHMYCSEAPCGDASMESIMGAQQDPTPWPIQMDLRAAHQTGETLQGRGYFSELGVVRRKPARGDSPISLSKSCSDKIALKQCTSLLSSLTSTILSPESAYLNSLIISEGSYVETAMARSFSSKGRMRTLVGSTWPGGFAFRPFDVFTTERNFEYSRRTIFSASTETKGSNISALWNPHMQETVINGVKQGWKQGDERGASAVSRAKMVEDVIPMLEGSEALKDCMSQSSSITYSDIKGSGLLKGYKWVKHSSIARAFHRWIQNAEDSFEIAIKLSPP